MPAGCCHGRDAAPAARRRLLLPTGNASFARMLQRSRKIPKDYKTSKMHQAIVNIDQNADGTVREFICDRLWCFMSMAKCANQVLEEGLSLESQRDSATKPRVARNELPW